MNVEIVYDESNHSCKLFLNGTQFRFVRSYVLFACPVTRAPLLRIEYGAGNDSLITPVDSIAITRLRDSDQPDPAQLQFDFG